MCYIAMPLRWPRSLLKGSDIDKFLLGENGKNFKHFYKVSTHYLINT